MFKKSAAPASGGYTIAKSLRFRSSASAYLSRTPGSTSNQKTWTWSGWVKRGDLSTYNTLWGPGSTNPTYDYIRFESDGTLNISLITNNLITTQVFRDPSAWYHIVVAVDTTQATASNRVKLYVNGNQVTAFGTAVYPPQNTNCATNTGSLLHNIGREWVNSTQYFPYDGYITELNFIDGQQLTASSFGSFSGTGGVWQPIKYTGTYGTNGFYLKFTDTTSTTTLCYDYSGNSNNWTPNNISLTAGATYDSMTDVPTLTSSTVANYCTFNPLDAYSTVTLSSGNLQASCAASGCVRSTIGMSSGKWYWETTVTSGTAINTGILAYNSALNIYLGQNTLGWGYNGNGSVYNNGSAVATLNSYTTGDVIGVAFDATSGKLWFSKNGVFQASGDPGAGTLPNVSSIPSSLYFSTVSDGTGATPVWSANFGQQGFKYTPPTGYVALNTYNLSTPTIAAGNQYMDATLFTSPGTTQTVTNAGSFKPDLVWQKTRSVIGSHWLVDSVRGVASNLNSNNTNAETSLPLFVTSLNSNGFSLGTDNFSNGTTLVGWQWQAGQGSTSSNTNGSLTSNVSVSTAAGFSVVTVTTQSSGTATFGHGLGVAPSLVITKYRNVINDWYTWHTSIPGTSYLKLNTADAVGSSAGIFSAAPTSTVINLGTLFAGNSPFLAYCWAAVPGFSAFGSYTGNGSADGPFIYTGFRPKFLMTKRTDSSTSGDWNMVDTTRGTYNVVGPYLYANLNNAEGNAGIYDILSNGFKIRESGSGTNANGSSYIYMAWAENPFKYALAR
jgi:hypothetical protein